MKNRSPLIRKLLTQYFITTGILMAILIIIPFAVRFVAGMRVWYGYEPIYQILRLFADYWLLCLAIGALLIWVSTTIYYMSKAISYLNETIQATNQLIAEPTKRIVLSSNMIDVQEEMNQLREKNLQDQRAAKEAEQRKNDLIVYLAHDLRTPLTSVIGYLTLLEEEPQLSTELRARYTKIALQKAQRLELLISEFFEITRFNLTTIALQTETTDLSLMLEQLTFEFLPLLEEKNLHWQLQLQKKVFATVDTEKMERVFDNLIRNAINYSYTDSPLHLAISASDDILIRLTNHGKTIPAEKIGLIFEPFYRMDASRATATGGTGLGLPIAKEIVEALGGKIWAESRDETIVFSIRLPKAAMEKNEQRSKPHPSEPTS
ncbi:vancomycin resistance histidine kinase VanS [Enterococcus sp.]|uniref:vancomycin resistance histidine kinase VanS n=1 Tax=Enterococcus sp. TaxID=35783 RepID=UPI00289E0A47|nr:vancomycin resistance histidine kinase VanS [Enterococcus sp.]